MKNILTFHEFLRIHNTLNKISDSWADLWILLNLTQVMITRLLHLKYQDIHGDVIILQARGRFVQQRLLITSEVYKIISRRRTKYPHDIYIFQSHSNRTKAIRNPVTVTAFNQALKIAAMGVTTKVVSSKSAKNIIFNHAAE